MAEEFHSRNFRQQATARTERNRRKHQNYRRNKRLRKQSERLASWENSWGTEPVDWTAAAKAAKEAWGDVDKDQERQQSAETETEEDEEHTETGSDYGWNAEWNTGTHKLNITKNDIIRAGELDDYNFCCEHWDEIDEKRRAGKFYKDNDEREFVKVGKYFIDQFGVRYCVISQKSKSVTIRDGEEQQEQQSSTNNDIIDVDATSDADQL